MVAIVAVPGVGFGFRISFRSGLSFPLSIDSISIRTVAIVAMSIAIMPQSIITVPGVGFSFSISFRSGLSFSLPIDSISIRTVAIVTMSIAIMPQSMAIIAVP